MSAPATDDIPVSDDEWLTVQDVARRLNVRENTLRSWLNRGTGPPFYRLGERLLRMRASEVDAWKERCRG